MKASLFDDEPVQLTLADGASRKITPRKSKITRRAQVPLRDLEDWLDFAESVLGRQDIPQDSLVGEFHNLADITKYEDQLEPWMGMDSFPELAARFPWLATVTEIAQAQGFFHWELRFAQVFADGGFDLQAGNPPWVRPRWEEAPILAELEPWFELAPGVSAEERRERKESVLASDPARRFYLEALTVNMGLRTFLTDTTTYPLLTGTQPDFYRGFMCQTWLHASSLGAVGLLHPDTHLEGVRDGKLRASAYQRLRMHASFVNGGNWAFPPPVDHNVEFGMNIYGPKANIHFLQASKLYGATVFTESLHHDGSGEIPRVKYQGRWDLRPHRARIIHVDKDRMTLWQALLGRSGEPLNETPVVHAVTTAELNAMGKLARYATRIGGDARIAIGYDELKARKDGYIREDVTDPGDWSEVMLQGAHFFVATPFAKQPPHMGSHDNPQDLTMLSADAVPATKYRRACSVDAYRRAQDRWVDYSMPEPVARPYTEFYRLAWREMIADNGERSLFACVIPPGPAHINAVRSMAMSAHLETALSSGFWASIVLDYLLRVTGRGHLNVSDARTMPAPEVRHPLASDLLMRTLLLNCLTDAYADLWRELYDPEWQAEAWACDWPNMPPPIEIGGTGLAIRRCEVSARVGPLWWRSMRWLRCGSVGTSMSSSQLTSRGSTCSGGTRKTCTSMRRVEGSRATEHAYGLGQTKEHWKQFELYLEDPEREPTA